MHVYGLIVFIDTVQLMQKYNLLKYFEDDIIW